MYFSDIIWATWPYCRPEFVSRKKIEYQTTFTGLENSNLCPVSISDFLIWLSKF